MKFLLLIELNENPKPLARKFLDKLNARLEDRRVSALVTLMLYLVNPNIFAETREHPLKLSTKAEAVKLGEKIMKRIFENIETGNDSELHNDSDTGSGTQDLAAQTCTIVCKLVSGAFMARATLWVSMKK